MGFNDKTFHIRTHLGHLLKPGDMALGYDMVRYASSGGIEANTWLQHLSKGRDRSSTVNVSDVILVKKCFEDDLKKIKYVKRLLRRYVNTNVLRTHLILNHLMVLFNVFGDAAVPLLFYNLERDLWSSIKSFLVFLGKLPEYPKSAEMDAIGIDEYTGFSQPTLLWHHHLHLSYFLFDN